MPLPALLAGALIGGVGGKLGEKLWEAGEKWLERYSDQSHPEALDRGRNNMAQFIIDLANRVNALERDQDSQVATAAQERQKDPDFMNLVHEALAAAAGTNDPERHAVLSRLVAERLLVESESRLALGLARALNAVKYLSSKHLRILGLLSLITSIRPVMKDLPVPQQVYETWMNSSLAKYLPFPDVEPGDVKLLESVHCLVIIHFSGRKELKDLLARTDENEKAWDPTTLLAGPLGPGLSSFIAPLPAYSMTSTGMLVGAIVHDQLTGTRTNITV